MQGKSREVQFDAAKLLGFDQLGGVHKSARLGAKVGGGKDQTAF